MEVKTAEKLWCQLKQLGNFSDSYYDKELLNNIKKTLSITGDFDKALDSVTVEALLTAFFDAMSPLVSMYSDILNLYERCNAQEGSSNIEIELKADEFNPTKFKREHFTQAKEVLQQIKCRFYQGGLSREAVNILWELPNYCRSSLLDTDIQNKNFHLWIEEYRNNENFWPDTSLDFEQTIRDSPIRETLQKAFQFWKALYSYYNSLPVTRDEIYNFWGDENSEENALYDRDLLSAEVDNCLGNIIESLYNLAEHYPALSSEERHNVDSRLDEFLEHCLDAKTEVSQMISAWKEFLSLPVWTHRYDVYSIWVFTQIIAEFPNDCMQFHVHDGVLSFPFSGAKLATAIVWEQEVQFWTEWKTDTIVAPVGKGRKKAIQPDYSIVCGDPNVLTDTILAVECKQYKKSNASNFSAAIIDYANNRPKAKILLAGYGPINTKVFLERVRFIPMDRYLLFSMCRPSTQIAKDFSVIIWNAVWEYIAHLNVITPFSFTLSWGEAPRDLDLHLLFRREEQGTGVSELSYNQDCIPDACYKGDVKDSRGPEQITIYQWNNGVYDLYVHNYSGSPTLSQSNASVEINSGKILTVKCPEEGSGQWWHVLRINTEEENITVVGKLLEQSPE